jgi:hypothetical protein
MEENMKKEKKATVEVNNDLVGKRFGNLVIARFDETENVYIGSLRGITVKVKYNDGKIFVNNYCTKCGNEFYYLYTRGKPNLTCDDCKANKAPEIVGEVEINGKIFVKYSNGMIRPKE